MFTSTFGAALDAVSPVRLAPIPNPFQKGIAASMPPPLNQKQPWPGKVSDCSAAKLTAASAYTPAVDAGTTGFWLCRDHTAFPTIVHTLARSTLPQIEMRIFRSPCYSTVSVTFEMCDTVPMVAVTVTI